MGKSSRRASRRERHKPRADQEGLTITVGVAPHVKRSGQPSLQREMRLLRSSLMYADRVDLVAPSAAWMNAFRPLRAANADDPSLRCQPRR